MDIVDRLLAETQNFAGEIDDGTVLEDAAAEIRRLRSMQIHPSCQPTITPPVSGEWFVFDPWEMSYGDRFNTEQEAIAHADHLIETGLDGGTWDEDVEGIFVARITHTPTRTSLEVPEWAEPGTTEWWHYDMTAVGI